MRCANLRQNAPFRQPKTLNAELSASGASFGSCIHLYIHTHFSFWHGVALGWGEAPYRRWRYGLLLRLFRPLGSIRLRVRPGLRFAYPGLCSGAPSGLMFRKPLRGYCGLGALLPPALPGATRGNPYGVYNTPSPFGVALCLPRAVFWRPFRAYVSETPTGLLWIGGAFTPGVAGGYSRKPLRGL